LRADKEIINYKGKQAVALMMQPVLLFTVCIEYELWIINKETELGGEICSQPFFTVSAIEKPARKPRPGWMTTVSLTNAAT